MTAQPLHCKKMNHANSLDAIADGELSKDEKSTFKEEKSKSSRNKGTRRNRSQSKKGKKKDHQKLEFEEDFIDTNEYINTYQ